MERTTLKWTKSTNERLRELRLNTGLPILVASRMAGVSPNVWWVWEAWGIPPKSFKTAEKIANLLGTTPEEIGWKTTR